MPDSTVPHDAAPDLSSRVATLEGGAREELAHRTRVNTLLSLAGAVAAMVVLGAITTRDAARDATAELATLRGRVATLEAAGDRRASDDRRTSEALIRLSTTVETLQTTLAGRLDSLEQRLQRAPAPR